MFKVTTLLVLALCMLAPVSSSLSAQSTTYQVNLVTIGQINVDLHDDCTRTLIPSNVLSGDFDADGDGLTPPDDFFRIVVQDDDPSNGPVIDGCGQFDFTIRPAPASAPRDDDGDGTPDNDNLEGFEFGRGVIMARDNTPPREMGTAEATSDLLFTTELLDLVVTNLPQSVSRTFTVESATGMPDITTISPPLLRLLVRGGDIPRFFDSCSDTEVTVSDVVVVPGPCEDITITRTFTARDASGVCSPDIGDDFAGSGVTTVSYDIVLRRPSGRDVSAAPELAEFRCDDPAIIGLGTENPAPAPTDFPFFNGPDGPIFLSENFGNIGVTFSDSERITIGCTNTIKFVRTYTVIDWCEPNNVQTFTQVVKIGDTEGPEIVIPDFTEALVISTNVPGCGALINTRLPGLAFSDGCSQVATVEAFVLINGEDDVLVGPGLTLSPVVAERLTPFVPEGEHIIRYVATDECGNVTTAEFPIRVEDNSGPVVIIQDQLNVSLSSDGFAVVAATDFDEGSYDDCSTVTLEIAFLNTVNLSAIGLFGPTITLTCTDVGEVPIIIRATDADGNTNERMAVIEVVDNSAPLCFAPPSIEIDCSFAAEQLPENINAEFREDPVGTIELFDQLFEGVTTLDNCNDEEITQRIVATLDGCGRGVIRRDFNVQDGSGFSNATPCFQTITVVGGSDYTVRFPGDASASCGEELEYEGVDVREFACGMVLTNTDVDTFDTGSDACFKLRVTYTVINTCEYDGQSTLFTIPRDADGDGDFEEPVFLHVAPGNATDGSEDTAVLDRDADRTNGSLRPLTGNYATNASRGGFQFVQFVKVTDEIAPVITNIVAEPGVNNGCEGGGIQIDYTIEDNCSVGATTSVQLDLDYLGANAFSPSRNLLGREIINNGAGAYSLVLSNIPTGRHAVLVRATDNCGNPTQRVIPFEIEGESGLVPICATNLRFVLLNDGAGGGIATITGEEFVADVQGNCSSAEPEFSVYLEETETGVPGFVPTPGREFIRVDCDDLGMLPLRVYVFAPGARSNSCTVIANVEPGNVDCTEGEASLAGFVTTPQRELLPDVEIYITDLKLMNDMQLTDDNGSFLFAGLEEGGQYMVKPKYPDAVNFRRVKTSDIIAIMNHILGVGPITDPYRMIAADVTGDGTVDINDMVDMRRVILGLDATFSRGPAWRFIRADYQLGQLKSGWDISSFPDSYLVEELVGDNRRGDFVAIEIGDVFLDGGTGRSVANLIYEDRELAEGERVNLTVWAADLAGLQATLEADPGLTITGWSSDVLSESNVNVTALERGQLAFSYNGEALRNTAGEVALLQLTLTAEHELRLSDYLYLSDRVLVSEAYPAQSTTELSTTRLTLFPTDLQPSRTGAEATSPVALHQNFPNPATDYTTIAFDLPRATVARLTLHDLSGRRIYVGEFPAIAGTNQVRLSVAADLKNTSGLLLYTLEVDGRRLTKRMTVVAH